MKYHHRFQVDAPQVTVAAFHQAASSMALITPPPIRVQMGSAPEQLSDGSEMDFTLWIGPIPVRWSARIEAVSASGFIDRQIAGPFAEWVHEHAYFQNANGRTEVHDRITIRIKRHILYAPLGLGFILGLPVLFAFRGWKTRQLLGRTHQR